MVVGHLQIMLVGDGCAIADPFADNVQRKPGREFGLPTRPHVVEQPGPRFQPRPFDDPQELRPKVGASVAIARDNERSSRRGLIPCRFQIRPQLGEQRNHARFAARMMFRLGASARVPNQCRPTSNPNVLTGSAARLSLRWMKERQPQRSGHNSMPSCAFRRGCRQPLYAAFRQRCGIPRNSKLSTDDGIWPNSNRYLMLRRQRFYPPMSRRRPFYRLYRRHINWLENSAGLPRRGAR